jgi:hypothetical protein
MYLRHPVILTELEDDLREIGLLAEDEEIHQEQETSSATYAPQSYFESVANFKARHGIGENYNNGDEDEDEDEDEEKMCKDCGKPASKCKCD